MENSIRKVSCPSYPINLYHHRSFLHFFLLFLRLSHFDALQLVQRYATLLRISVLAERLTLADLPLPSLHSSLSSHIIKVYIGIKRVILFLNFEPVLHVNIITSKSSTSNWMAVRNHATQLPV